MNKPEEVPGRLLVPRRDPTVLLEQVDGPLDLLPLLVQMPVMISLPLPVLLRRDHRLAPPPPRRPDDRVAVVRLVEDVGARLMGTDQRPGPRDIGLLAPRQAELHRVAQRIDGDGDPGRGPP